MNTPVADFVQRYAKAGTARLHMPGHKGRCFLGCEPWDLTEIPGADALYEAESYIASDYKERVHRCMARIQALEQQLEERS